MGAITSLLFITKVPPLLKLSKLNILIPFIQCSHRLRFRTQTEPSYPYYTCLPLPFCFTSFPLLFGSVAIIIDIKPRNSFRTVLNKHSPAMQILLSDCAYECVSHALAQPDKSQDLRTYPFIGFVHICTSPTSLH